MGNYYEGNLNFCVRKDTPIDILNDYIEANTRFGSNGSIHVYGIGETSYEIKEKIIPENINRYDYFVVSVYIYTKYYISNKIEDYLISIRDKLYPYIENFGFLLEDLDSDGINYIGTISDEDHTYRKIFVWDDSILNKVIKSREFLCKDCKFTNYRNDPLCSRFDACKRAYLLGAEKGAKKAVDFYDSKEQKIKSTLDNIESRLDNILSKIQTNEGVENE